MLQRNDSKSDRDEQQLRHISSAISRLTLVHRKHSQICQQFRVNRSLRVAAQVENTVPEKCRHIVQLMLKCKQVGCVAEWQNFGHWPAN